MVLLTGAGLLLNSFERLVRVAVGFDADDLVAIDPPLDARRYSGCGQQATARRQSCPTGRRLLTGRGAAAAGRAGRVKKARRDGGRAGRAAARGRGRGSSLLIICSVAALGAALARDGLAQQSDIAVPPEVALFAYDANAPLHVK